MHAHRASDCSAIRWGGSAKTCYRAPRRGTLPAGVRTSNCLSCESEIAVCPHGPCGSLAGLRTCGRVRVGPCVPTSHRFPPVGAVLHDGGRSHLPLRDSSGFAPDSLFSVSPPSGHTNNGPHLRGSGRWRQSENGKFYRRSVVDFGAGRDVVEQVGHLRGGDGHGAVGGPVVQAQLIRVLVHSRARREHDVADVADAFVLRVRA